MRGLRSQNVIQMRRTVPLVPAASASVKLSPALMATVGAPFRPPFACAARPFSPFGFSPLAQRVSTPSGISKSDCADADEDAVSINANTAGRPFFSHRASCVRPSSDY